MSPGGAPERSACRHGRAVPPPPAVAVSGPAANGGRP
ncbi:hypothetical protein FsymDg_3319 [Candidatus Protofrankia datiscae]|uniref:Uncharacterized protein n=1 Tax=Candidatus Protofrankia datiscae TaxID=2716812 RepID=F8AZX8_9ACTN|nr:hypothetical protein FsymDg_3319 [Candidatus Protofrankia datiscae]